MKYLIGVIVVALLLVAVGAPNSHNSPRVPYTSLDLFIDVSGSESNEAFMDALYQVASMVESWVKELGIGQVSIFIVDDPNSVWIGPRRTIVIPHLDSTAIRNQLVAERRASIGIAGKRMFEEALACREAEIRDSIAAIAEYVSKVTLTKAYCSAIIETAYRIARLPREHIVVYLTDLLESCTSIEHSPSASAGQSVSSLKNIIIGFIPAQSDGADDVTSTERYLERKAWIEKLLPQATAVPYYELDETVCIQSGARLFGIQTYSQ